MDELISKQAAIDVFYEFWGTSLTRTVDAINKLPPVQPTQLTDDDIETIRLHLSAIKENLCNQNRWNEAKEYEALIDRLTAQPKQRTGHWIPVGVVEVVGGESAMWGSAIAYHKCSKCGGQALRDDFDEEVLSDFCPNCGAKMGVSNDTHRRTD